MLVGRFDQRRCGRSRPASRMFVGLPSFAAARLPDRQCGLGALRDQPPFLLGQRGVEVQHERVGVAAEFGDDERHALRHQAGDERDIAGEAVQLRDQDAAFRGLGGGQRGCELRPAIERVRALAGFGLDVLGDDRDVLGFGEAGDRRALRLDPEPRALLLPSRDTKVGNSAVHTKCIPPFALCMNPLSEQCHCCFHVAQQRELTRSLAKNAHNRIHARACAIWAGCAVH